MGAKEMYAKTFVQVSITSWVRAGSWTNVQHVTVEKVAKQLVLCRCAREIRSAKTSLLTAVIAALSAGMKLVCISLVAQSDLMAVFE